MFKLEKREVFGKEDGRKTRPDTRPIPVTDRWAGAELRVFTLFVSCSQTNGRTDGQMDGRMDGRTDGRTDKGRYRVACPQLKKKKREEERNMESKIERKKERVNKNKE